MSTNLKVRNHHAGESFDAIRLAERTRIGVDEDDAITWAEAGSVLVLSNERHPDWPPTRIIKDMFGPHEGDRLAAAYELLEESEATP
jgi:hypothetical protein